MRIAESGLIASLGVAAAMAVLAALAPPAFAGSGDLDSSFGVGGKVVTAIGGNFNGAHAVAIDGDGKIVAAGVAADDYALGGYYADFALARYNTNGSLDTSFGANGMVRTVFAGSNSTASALAIQADGRIVAAGAKSDPGEFALVRYQPDGLLDTSFGADGMVTTDFPGALGHDAAHGVALQQDGKIVAVGTVDSRRIGLVRYNTDGTLDSTFGVDGMVTTGFPRSGGVSGAAVAMQTDGKIVVVGGVSLAGGDSTFGSVRYNPDGSRDATFGDRGRVRTIFGQPRDYANAVALQVDGKILAVGISGGSEQKPRFALCRYETDGTLDTSFGGDGKVTSSTAHGAEATAVALQVDGGIVAAGYSFGEHPKFALSRYKTDGTLDSSFGEDGKVITNFESRIDGASAIAIQADGKIVAAGTSWGWFGYFDYGSFAIARYLSA
jgi:uncharacterized delta-60 repeat protein